MHNCPVESNDCQIDGVNFDYDATTNTCVQPQLPFTIVDAFCTSDDGVTTHQTCRVEGGETLTIIGKSFQASDVDISTIQIMLGGNQLCSQPIVGDVEIAGQYKGYRRLTCKTPCFSQPWNMVIGVTVSATCAIG